jgi:hypothetical protein
LKLYQIIDVPLALSNLFLLRIFSEEFKLKEIQKVNRHEILLVLNRLMKKTTPSRDTNVGPDGRIKARMRA